MHRLAPGGAARLGGEAADLTGPSFAVAMKTGVTLAMGGTSPSRRPGGDVLDEPLGERSPGMGADHEVAVIPSRKIPDRGADPVTADVSDGDRRLGGNGNTDRRKAACSRRPGRGPDCSAGCDGRRFGRGVHAWASGLNVVRRWRRAEAVNAWLPRWPRSVTSAQA